MPVSNRMFAEAVTTNPMGLDVLVADRDAELAKRYCRFLSGQGFSTRTTSSGLECLMAVHQYRPRVLILDRDLPWGDGEGVLACLREDGLAIPVILTAWNALAENVQRLVAPPVVLCLAKMFSFPVLLDGVVRAVNQGSMTSVAECLGSAAPRETAVMASR